MTKQQLLDEIKRRDERMADLASEAVTEGERRCRVAIASQMHSLAVWINENWLETHAARRRASVGAATAEGARP